MKRVLVTGASGFIGRQTLPLLLERGFEVHALSSKPPRAMQLPVEWHTVNLLDAPDLMPLMNRVRPSHLLHLAWYTQPKVYWSDPLNLNWVTASVALLIAFHASGGERILGVGTCAEYDWRFGFCSEDITPTIPNTLYGSCKLALAQLLQAYAGTTDLSWSWARVFYLYGPHEHPDRLVPAVVRALLRGVQAECTSGTQTRDYLHVLDAASALVAILDSTAQGIVNVGSGKPVSISDVISTIASLIGREELVAWGTVAQRTGDPPLLCADVRRLNQHVLWSPSVNLDDGIASTIDWWRQKI